MDNEIYVKNNLKKITIIIAIGFIIVSIIFAFSLYIANVNFRKWIDTNLLGKNVLAKDTVTIDLNTDKSNQIFCFSKYITILNDRNLTLYNNSANIVVEIPVDINTAIFSSSKKYLALAEKDGHNFSLIFDKTYLWTNKIEGTISKISVNENGYVAVVTTDMTYKSIITLYNPEGKKLLDNYLSSTRVIDVSISNDNKYVAFAEMDTTGALIKSNIKIISIEKTQSSGENAIIYTYNADPNKLVISINYQEKGQIACMYSDSISVINQQNVKNIVQTDNSINFMCVELEKDAVYVQEENQGLFKASSNIMIVDTLTGHINTYNLEEIPKEIYAFGNTIGINVGTDIYFINSNGMLIKKYISNQEITNVMLTDEVAAIIYKDRIEIINL